MGNTGWEVPHQCIPNTVGVCVICGKQLMGNYKELLLGATIGILVANLMWVIRK